MPDDCYVKADRLYSAMTECCGTMVAVTVALLQPDLEKMTAAVKIPPEIEEKLKLSREPLDESTLRECFVEYLRRCLGMLEN